MTREQLKPCPFCGESSATTQHVRDGRRAYCRSCGASACSAFHGPNDDTEQRAIAAWNTRASLPQDKRIAVLEEALEPFANMDDANMNDPLSKWLRVGHIKAAFAALNGGSNDQG